MTSFIFDIHDIPASGTVGQTMRKHLRTVHEIDTADDPCLTLNDLSRAHASKHDRLGRTDPENDSETTLRQKRELQVKHVTEFHVILPEWVYTHSYLSDLKSLDRLLRAAYLARPSSALNQPLTGVDNPTQA